ncbi:MAG TPA: cation-transporting P-type ATPase [Alphaproteobacteria bacterium]
MAAAPARLMNARAPAAAIADAHAVPAAGVLSRLGVDPARGLGWREVAARRRRYGRNRLPAQPARSLWSILADQFKSLVVVLLAAAAALSWTLREWTEGTAIMVVLLINGAIGFVTELRAVRSMEALRRLATVATRVRRAGRVRMRPAQALVPGDVVVIEGGDIVTADLRLVEAARLQCDESTLTGESVPVDKSTEALPPEAPVTERANMLYRGTAVTRGSGIGVVVATGAATELGQISALAQAAAPETSPLEKRLDRLGGQLVWATVALVAVVGGLGVLRGNEPLLMIETAIALAVAAVPEGLPIVATMALARGMWRMARRNVLIRRLSAVETLGATTVVLTDKTGTLTENRMTVTWLELDRLAVEVGGAGEAAFTAGGAALDARADPRAAMALRIAVACNNAALEPVGEDGAARGVGDPMEVALLLAAAKAGLDRATVLRDWPEQREEAFSSDVKMMATVHRAGAGYMVAVKGAPEAVLAAATAVLGADGPIALDAARRAHWTRRIDRLAADGLRVLALAMKETADADDSPYRDLTLVGLVALIDPPRGEVPAAVAACRRAGVQVVMVTGDHAETARAIARAVGIGDPGDATGGGGVFARVTPETKLDLVARYQAQGEIVAMTGDGVNDAPALRKADIGVAMGRRGSDVAREAADMVLRDDSFASIVAAMHQGRVIFGNIRKFVCYLMSCNLSEILVIGAGAVSGLPLPLLPLQILYLNLVTDVFPAFALGAGEGEADIMERPPRDPAEPILGRRHWAGVIGYGALIAAATLGAFLIALARPEGGEEAAVTVAFLTLAFAQLWHVFNMREAGSPLFANEITRNGYVWGALALCVGLMAVAVGVPPVAEVLGLAAPDLRGWLLALALSLVPLAAGQLLKLAPRRRRR